MTSRRWHIVSPITPAKAAGRRPVRRSLLRELIALVIGQHYLNTLVEPTELKTSPVDHRLSFTSLYGYGIWLVNSHKY